MLPLLAALGFAYAAPLPSCALAHPERCVATNELVVAPGFETALRRFVGPGRASWFEPNGDITDQLLMTLYGPGFDTVRLPDRMFQFGACMAHVCPERGAVFVTPAGEIRMATMLFHNWRQGMYGRRALYAGDLPARGVTGADRSRQGVGGRRTGHGCAAVSGTGGTGGQGRFHAGAYRHPVNRNFHI